MFAFLLCGLPLFFSGSTVPTPLITTRTDSLIQHGTNLSIRQAYDEAIEIFQSLEQSHPQNPVGYFFHAAVLHARMMDYELYDDEEAFLELIQRTASLSESWLRADSRQPWAFFFLGGAKGYLAFYQAKQNRLIEAFENGKQSIQALQLALKADSTLYDAYLGLGTYKYYRSKLSRHFNWLPFIGDDREAGIRMLKLAIDKSKYSRFSALNGFFWIALEEERFQEAHDVVEFARDRFPESRLFLWCAAKLAVERGNWHESIGFFQSILESLAAGQVLSAYNELVCRKNLVQAYLQLGENVLAASQCERISELTIDEDNMKRHPDTLKEARDSCREIAGLLTESR